MSCERRCCACGKALSSDAAWYVCTMEIFAGADDLVISPEDLLRDHQVELTRLAGLMSRIPVAELEADVYQFHRWILCATCLRKIGGQGPGTRG